MSVSIPVCFQGFSAFEHGTLCSSLRLAVHRTPRYLPVDAIAQAELIVVDADHGMALADVVRAGRLEDAVFIAAQVEDEGPGWLARPLDPGLLFRELDRLVAQRTGAPVRANPGFDSSADTATPSATGHAKTDAKTSAKTSPTAAQHASTPPLAARSRALVVDDSEIAAIFLETFLRRYGMDIDKAAHSGKAIELLSQRAYDVVFLDIELGRGSDLDGLALCQHIKRLHRHVGSSAAPLVVMVSAHHSEVDRARGALAGCDAYLAKPLDDDLMHRLLLQHGVLAPTGGPQPSQR